MAKKQQNAPDASMTERYVYDVTRRLPEKQRADIERELITLIEDMLAERVGEGVPTEKDVAVVLTELGNPAELAEKYRDDKRCLIGSQYYDSYLLVLKIVLPCVALGLFIANLISLSTEPSPALAAVIIESIASLFGGVVTGFAWVTLIFAILERATANKGERWMQATFKGNDTGAWTPAELPTIPVRSALIKRGDSIASIVFSVLVLVIFLFVPEFFGVWTNVGATGFKIIPIFHMEIWGQLLFFFAGCCILGLAKDTTRLVVGRHGYTVMITTIVTNLLGLILSVIVFTGFDVWNPNFVMELKSVYGVSIIEGISVLQTLFSGGLEKVFVILCALGFGIDTIAIVAKTLMLKKPELTIAI